MINNLSDMLSAETLVSQLSFVKDASEEVEIKRKEDEAKPSDPYEDAFKSTEIGDANIEEDLEENNTSDKVVTDNVVK